MANNSRPKIHFESVEELLGAPITMDGAQAIEISDIVPFENHPFKVLDNEKMDELVESIQSNGVITPVIVRPNHDGTYEMISGHRRMHAAKKAGLTTLPSIVKELDDDEAIILMTDSNVQREEILPSERAWSLKMKMDAMSRQGYRSDRGDNDTSTLKGWKRETASAVGETVGLAKNQVRRYVRLTNLIPELRDMVDEKKVTVTLGVEISYIDVQIQKWIYDYIKESGFVKPEQIKAIRESEALERFTQADVIRVMNDALSTKRKGGGVNLSEKKLDKYFSSHITYAEREKIIIKLLEYWKENESIRKL